MAEYQTMLPPKAVLRRKLHELYVQLASGTDADPREAADAAPDTSVQPSARRKRASVTASSARPKAKGKRS